MKIAIKQSDKKYKTINKTLIAYKKEKRKKDILLLEVF